MDADVFLSCYLRNPFDFVHGRLRSFLRLRSGQAAADSAIRNRVPSCSFHLQPVVAGADVDFDRDIQLGGGCHLFFDDEALRVGTF